MEGYLAEIRMFAGNFNPRGWFFCTGQLLSIAEYTALYSLLGTTFGGDGTITFALPDFKSRIPVGTGSGAGLTSFQLGEMGGSETTTLIAANIPAHTHTITGAVTPRAASNGTLGSDPANRYIGPGSFYAGNTDLQKMAPAQNTLALAAAGSNTSFNKMPPYLGINYIIAAEGIYPSRN
jgi:microcystin-dependent protein